MGVIRGARICTAVSAQVLKVIGMGKTKSAIVRWSARPELGGNPDKALGPFRSNAPPCQPEGSCESKGISPKGSLSLSTRIIRCIANPASGADKKAFTKLCSLSGRKMSSASIKQIISPWLFRNAEFNALDWPSFAWYIAVILGLTDCKDCKIFREWSVDPSSQTITS